MDVIKGIEIIDDVSVIEEFEQQVRNKGFSVYQVGSKTLYAIGDSEKERESLNEAIEENAFVLNLDYARAKLFYVKKETGQIRESKTLMEQFSLENDVDDILEGIPVSLLPELIDFVGDNPASVDEDISVLFDDMKTDDSGLEVERLGEDVKEKSSDMLNDLDNDFVDDVEDDSIGDVLEKNEDVPENTENVPEKAENVPQKQEEVLDEEQDNVEKQYKDYLMEKAIALFDSQQPMSLPQFDELTHKELQEQVIESQFTVSKARDKSINTIYNRLKNETTESIETIKTNVIESARKKHEEVLNKIERNYKYEVEKVLNEHNAEYEKDRENYIQSQIPVLRKQYDAKHGREYDSVLTAKIERLRKKSNEEIAEERERFQSYVDSVLDDSKEKAMSSVRIDDIIEEYNKITEEQRELLLLKARSKKKEIGSTLSEIVKERDQLKSEIDDFQEKLEAQKQSEQERIDSGVSVALEQKKQELIKENKAKLDEAYNKEKDLVAKIERLERALATEKAEKDSMKREYIEPAKEIAATEERDMIRAGNHPSYVQPETSKFRKIKFIVGCGVSASFLFLSAVGVFTLSDIKDEMARSNYLDQSAYIAQLESDERYDKVAEKMKEFGYGDKSIAEMYLEHGSYILALKTDKSILPDVYTFVEQTSEDKEEQKKRLETVKKHVDLDDQELDGLNVRIAILDEDTEAINAFAFDKGVDADSAEKVVRYYIDTKDFESADKLLKEHPDEKLYEEMETAKSSEMKEKAESLKEDIESLEKKISDNDKKVKGLEKDLKKVKKSKNKKKKEKEIKKNKDKKKELEKELEEKQNKLEELEKEL